MNETPTIDHNAYVFVFGSNLAGIHGAGAALFARKYRGAILGKGVGFFGQSYAIPTKDANVTQTLPLEAIRKHVDDFLTFAFRRRDLDFQITRIGCGLAGLHDADVAPMFEGATENCWFDSAWSGHNGIRADRIWGTF